VQNSQTTSTHGWRSVPLALHWSRRSRAELNAKMVEVHSYVHRLVNDQAPEAISQAVDECLNARNAFETAAKKELGID
jgi:hypothetical protein